MKHYLLFSVIITGACVLILEILAIRIIAPYFGNTIYTFSAVITTILSALSFGYFLGGKIADKYPSYMLFYFVVSISGFSIMLMEILRLVLLPIISFKLADASGALYISLLLFFLPAFILGIVSPFAVKLSSLNSSNQMIGSISGTVFFWSTFGSIIGSLSAGYVLIPNLGINIIILGISILLISVGIIGLTMNKINLKYLKILILLLFITAAIQILLSTEKRGLLFEKDGIYEKIQIFDKTYNSSKTRFVLQDQNYSGAMFLNSDELVYEYTKYYEIYKFINPQINNALVLGGSASYSIPKALLKENRKITIDVVDIEPSFPILAKKYFRLSDDHRLVSHIIDGRRFLNINKNKYDLIISDVYLNLNSVPMHFTTAEFFQLVNKSLNRNGVFIANFIGALSQQPPSLLLSEVKTLKTVFPNSYLFAVNSPKSKTLQNFILMGVKDKKQAEFDTKIYSSNKFLNNVKMHNINLSSNILKNQIVFTDNYAPIELLTAKVL